MTTSRVAGGASCAWRRGYAIDARRRGGLCGARERRARCVVGCGGVNKQVRSARRFAGLHQLDFLFQGDAAVVTLTPTVVALWHVAQIRHEVLDCTVELHFCVEVREGVQRKVRCARGVKCHLVRAGLNELAQLLAVRVVELKPTEKRNDAISQSSVIYVISKNMKTTYFFGFVCAEPRDMMMRAHRSRGRQLISKKFSASFKNALMRTPDDSVNRKRFADIRSKSGSYKFDSWRADGGGRFVIAGATGGCGYVRRWLGAFATALLTETAGIRNPVCVGIGTGWGTVLVEAPYMIGLTALRGFSTTYFKFEADRAECCRNLKNFSLSVVVGLQLIANCCRT